MSYFPWEDNDREGFKNRYKNLEVYMDKNDEEHKAEDKAGHKGKQQHVTRMSYFPWEDNDREGFKNRYKNLEVYMDKNDEEHKAEDKAGHKGKQQHVNVKGEKKHMHGKNKEGQYSGKNNDKAHDNYNKSGGQRLQSEYQRGFINGYQYAHNSGFKDVYGHSIWDGHDNSSDIEYGEHVQYSSWNIGNGYHGSEYGYDSRDSEHSYHGFGYDSRDSEHSYHGFGYDIRDNEHGFEYDYEIRDSEHGFEYDYDSSN